MAYGDNIVGNISRYVQEINEMAVLVARDTNFVTGLVTVFTDNAGTAARNRSEYGTATFNQITDSDDLTSQAFTPSVVNTLTPSFFGAQFFITDRRLRSDPMNAQSDAARELGEAAAKKVQVDVLSAMASFTGGTVGTAGGTLTWGNIYKGVAALKQQNPRGRFIGILGNGQWYHLGTVTVPAGAQTNAPALQDTIAAQYFVGRIFGVDWYVSNDVSGALGTAAKGGVFTQEAIGFDERLPFGINPERDESRGGGGWELNATMEYASGIWRPKFGVTILGTDVLP
jgi:hypothetical protein